MYDFSVEMTDDEFAELQSKQYRNGESLDHTLLRLAGLRPEPEEVPPASMDTLARKMAEGMAKEGDRTLLGALLERVHHGRSCLAPVGGRCSCGLSWAMKGPSCSSE
jgi:hypothetical protein